MEAAISALKERLKQKNISISPNKRRNISEKELFEEMERIWRLVGHRPSKNEWAANDPKFSDDTIVRQEADTSKLLRDNPTKD